MYVYIYIYIYIHTYPSHIIRDWDCPIEEFIAQGGLCAGLAPGHWSREAAHL